MCAYSTSKAAVIGLAKAAGKEYAETGITINALAPAVIRTGITDHALYAPSYACYLPTLVLPLCVFVHLSEMQPWSTA